MAVLSYSPLQKPNDFSVTGRCLQEPCMGGSGALLWAGRRRKAPGGCEGAGSRESLELLSLRTETLENCGGALRGREIREVLVFGEGREVFSGWD